MNKKLHLKVHMRLIELYEKPNAYDMFIFLYFILK